MKVLIIGVDYSSLCWMDVQHVEGDDAHPFRFIYCFVNCTAPSIVCRGVESIPESPFQIFEQIVVGRRRGGNHSQNLTIHFGGGAQGCMDKVASKDMIEEEATPPMIILQDVMKNEKLVKALSRSKLSCSDVEQREFQHECL